MDKKYFPAIVDGLPKRYLDCSFDNFKLGFCPNALVDACKELSANNGDSITLVGNTGTGKTHLAISIMKNQEPILRTEKEWEKDENELKGIIQQFENCGGSEEKAKWVNGKRFILEKELYKYRQCRSIFLPIVTLMMRLNDAVANGNKTYQLEQIMKYDCVCLDDLGAEKLTEASQQNLYYLIDTRYREGLSTIITSNFTIEQINKNEPRIASRLAEMGKILLFNGKDYRVN